MGSPRLIYINKCSVGAIGR